MIRSAERRAAKEEDGKYPRNRDAYRDGRQIDQEQTVRGVEHMLEAKTRLTRLIETDGVASRQGYPRQCGKRDDGQADAPVHDGLQRTDNYQAQQPAAERGDSHDAKHSAALVFGRLADDIGQRCGAK